MKYNYLCNDCSVEDCFVFEVEHSIKEDPEIQCPKCKGYNTQRTFIGVRPPSVYTRGYGWLDVKGRTRDRDLYKLVNDDPYGGMRQSGEKSDLVEKLRRGGRRKTNRKVFAGKGKK